MNKLSVFILRRCLYLRMLRQQILRNNVDKTVLKVTVPMTVSSDWKIRDIQRDEIVINLISS
jgi:hypothetical protein